MRFPLRGASPAVTALSVLMLLLLAVLAGLQYRWTGQLGIAEREQMRANVQSTVGRFAADFDRELSRAFTYFLPARGQRDANDTVDAKDVDGALAATLFDRYDYWEAYAPYPELVREVYLARRDGQEMLLERLNPTTRRLEATDWDGDLAAIRQALADPDPRRRDRGRSWDTSPVFDEIPALVVPFSERIPSGGRRSTSSRGLPTPEGRFVIVELGREYIVDELLPLLTERHFGDGAYELTVRRAPQRHEVSGSGDEGIIYLTGKGDASGREVDASAPLFGLVSGHELTSLYAEAGHSARDLDGQGRRGGSRRRGPSPPRGGGDRPWMLTATHRSGSLTAAIAAVRFRNLSISFGILVLLAGSVTLILVSARRAQDLARERMEFVAGVSHELRTPLSVICSAGQNLADGVTDDPRRVREYGALIRDEGRRLSEIVGQVLEHASVQSGRKTYAHERVSARAVVEAALESCRPLIDDGGFQVDASYPDVTLEVEGDPRALERAVQNLIANAVKYSGDQAWIGIRVATRAGAGGDELCVTVEDRGRGIAAAERKRIFEPFFRGASAVAEQIHGNGLGLSLVRQIAEAHGGNVSVISSTGGKQRGSAFTLHLPLAPPGRSAEPAGRHEAADGEVGQPARG